MCDSTFLKTALLGTFALFMAGQNPVTTQQVTQPEKKPGFVPLGDGVSAAELVRVYRTNAAAADERFSFKPVRVTGRMMRIVSEGVLVTTSNGKSETRYDLEMAGGERVDPKN